MKQNYSLLFWLNTSRMQLEKAAIYCRITVNGKRAELSVKRFIEPSKWIKTAGMVKGSSEEARIINNQLDIIRTSIYRIYVEQTSLGKFITSDLLKNEFLGNTEKEKTFLEAFKYHNDQMKELIGTDVVKSTHTKFETVYKKCSDFLKKRIKRSDVYLKELDYKFITDFEHYLKTEGIAHNTAMKYIRNVKKVINQTVLNGWLQRNPFAQFKCSTHAVIREILDEAELSALYSKEFKQERLEEVRDVFLFCCFTGYAFIDVFKLKQTDVAKGIDGDCWIFTRRTKTNTVSNVPLLPQAEEIVNKYKNHPKCVQSGKLLPVNSNQKMNAYLKEIATLCNINKELTMHIARHTFATTVTLSNGVPIESVSKMLGHKKLATTQIYAKVLEHKVSEDMQQLKQKFTLKRVEQTGTY
ncbi:MAG: site-specific integrase [Flavobacteriales bacterium]|nr:site-specific integrase [Flavobacteriales bacterium]